MFFNGQIYSAYLLYMYLNLLKNFRFYTVAFRVLTEQYVPFAYICIVYTYMYNIYAEVGYKPYVNIFLNSNLLTL